MCETVWSISGVGAGILRGSKDSTRGFFWTNQWCIGSHSSGKRRVAMFGLDNC